MNKNKILNIMLLSGLFSITGLSHAVDINYTRVSPGFVTTSPSIDLNQMQAYPQQQDTTPAIPESRTNQMANQKQQQAQMAQAGQQPGQNAAQQPAEPGTAFDQGYGQDQVDVNKEISDYQEFNSARQRGVTVTVPMPKASWAKSKSNQIWFTNWKGVLIEKAGISSQKIDFEASRLSKEEFAEWATRQVRVVDPNANYVNY